MIPKALAVVALAFGAGACISILGDFDDKGTGGASTKSSSSTGSSSTGAAPTTSSSSAGGVPTTSSSSTGGAPTTSSGSTGAAPTTSSSSTSSGSTLPPVYCAGTPCGPGLVCCFDLISGDGNCAQAGECALGRVEVQCTSPADCPGGFCCARGTTLAGEFVYESVSCASLCSTTSNDQFPLCDPNDTDVCGETETCTPSTVLGDPYYVCNN